MKVLLLIWSTVFLLHCVTAEENTEAELAEKTFTESEVNLLSDLEDALNVQTRDEPDGSRSVDGDADENGDGEDKNQVRELALEVRDLLKQDNDYPGVEDPDVVESLKRNLENTAVAGNGEEDGEDAADIDDAEDSLDTQSRGWFTRCKKRSKPCSSRSKCCSGLSCRYSSYYRKLVCASRITYQSCRRRYKTCVYGSSRLKCCRGLYCKRNGKRYRYRVRYGNRWVYKYRYRYSSVGQCR